MQYSAQIKSVQSEVTQTLIDTEQWMLSQGINGDQASETCLVLAEALNNVVEHAYGYDETGDIDVKITVSGTILTAEIKDSGPKFSLPERASNSAWNDDDLEQLPEGGFGWNLIFDLTDEVILRQKNRINHLVLKRKI